MKCEYCNKKHKGEYGSGRFCSQKCARGFASKDKRKEINQRVSCTLKKLYSDDEKSSLLKEKSRQSALKNFSNPDVIKRRNESTRKRKEKERLDRWKQWEESREFPELKNLGHIKKYLESKFGHVCKQCGLTEWQGVEIPLVVDHIDGNNGNFKVENFRLICNNCDSISPTFKGKNRGNGRKLRVEHLKLKIAA